MKKIFSLNLAAYLFMITKEMPQLAKDNRNMVYFLFPDTPTISFLINTYKVGNPMVGLKDLTAAYKQIRQSMSAYRYSDGGIEDGKNSKLDR